VLNFCTYVHRKPDGAPFYVGKGRVARATNVGASRRNEHYLRIVEKYGASNIRVEVFAVGDEAAAFALEHALIAKFRSEGWKLANVTDGGEGVAGFRLSADSMARKISACRGYKHTSETRAKISAGHMGKFVSEVTRQKISASMKGMQRHPAFLARAKMGASGAANPHAKAVTAVHPEHGTLRFDTYTSAATHIGVNVSKISAAISRGGKSKGWALAYTKEIL
jgi:hypothetical protein